MKHGRSLAPTIEQVSELRDRAARYRIRLRNLEAALMRKALAALTNIDPALISLDGMSVDENGNVIGAREALRRHLQK